MSDPFLKHSVRELIKKIGQEGNDPVQHLTLYKLLLENIPEYFFTGTEGVLAKDFKIRHEKLLDLLNRRGKDPNSESLTQEQLEIWLYFQGYINPYRKNESLMDYERDIERRKHEFITYLCDFYRKISFPDPDTDMRVTYRIVYYYIRMLAWSGSIFEGNFEHEVLFLYHTKKVKNILQLFLREKGGIDEKTGS